MKDLAFHRSLLRCASGLESPPLARYDISKSLSHNLCWGLIASLLHDVTTPRPWFRCTTRHFIMSLIPVDAMLHVSSEGQPNRHRSMLHPYFHLGQHVTSRTTHCAFLLCNMTQLDCERNVFIERSGQRVRGIVKRLRERSRAAPSTPPPRPVP